MAGERLTGWDKGKAYILRCFGEHDCGGGVPCEHMDTIKCNNCEHMHAVCHKLAVLEDGAGGEITIAVK